jgi:hypothetical protein
MHTRNGGEENVKKIFFFLFEFRIYKSYESYS